MNKNHIRFTIDDLVNLRLEFPASKDYIISLDYTDEYVTATCTNKERTDPSYDIFKIPGYIVYVSRDTSLLDNIGKIKDTSTNDTYIFSTGDGFNHLLSIERGKNRCGTTPIISYNYDGSNTFPSSVSINYEKPINLDPDNNEIVQSIPVMDFTCKHLFPQIYNQFSDEGDLYI